MFNLNLEDSHFTDPIQISEESKNDGIRHEFEFDAKDSPFLRAAVDSLRAQFEGDNVNGDKVIKLSLQNQASSNDQIECPIWYKTKCAWQENSRKSKECISFYTSHYVGSCIIKDISIKIRPRFGNKVFNRMLQDACNIYLPSGNISYHENCSGNSYWLIGLLWKAMLERAMTIGQIPKEYKTETKNIKTFKGRLSIQKHIKTNIVDQTRFYCSYRKLSMDNKINQTIRYTYDLLANHGLSKPLNNIAAYDIKLASFGVTCPEIEPSSIDDIIYTKMNEVYRPVMEFSKAIISYHVAEETSNMQVQGESAFFIDMAELWEMYLLRILQKNLGSEYTVYSPNLSAGGFLLEDEYRSIRPDIIIEKDNKVVMIVDAKYKKYKTLGKTAQNNSSVSREDLYQMTTYLYHYGKEGNPICGIFVSPEAANQNEKPKSLEHNPLHKIGLVNMEIDEAGDNLELLEEKERDFANRIKKLLESKIDEN